MIFVPFSTNVPHSAERTMMGDHATLTIAAPCIFDGNSMRGAGLVHIRNGRIAGITLGELEKIASGSRLS